MRQDGLRRQDAGPRRLADFTGRWRLERCILQRGGPPARLTGSAEWREGEGGLVCTERGVLEIDGQGRFEAERRYLWREGLVVHFEDGRLFHAVPPAGGAARHWCAPDLYRVQYRFARWPTFQTLWRVTGPRKDYAMLSRYAPMDA